MGDETFEKFAEEAAAGLKADRELFLDVKREISSHLEEKEERFIQEGNSPEKSAELAKKSFGSPMDVAAELQSANRRRMRLRSLLRLTFGALIVPAALILALTLSYGRIARLSVLTSFYGTTSYQLPYFRTAEHRTGKDAELSRLSASPSSADADYRFWEKYKSDPDSYMYYAYYAFAESGNRDESNDAAFVDAMTTGQKIEPENALYNVLLADHYFRKGIELPKKNSGDPPVLTDRKMFDLGVAEALTAAGKPYLHTYQDDVLRKKLSGWGRPVLTEDYVRLMILSGAEIYPQISMYRNLSREIPGAARILISQGRREEAERLMDTWQPYPLLFLDDTSSKLISVYVARTSGEILSDQAAEVYNLIGNKEKARNAQAALERLRSLHPNREGGGAGLDTQRKIQLHGSVLAEFTTPVFLRIDPGIRIDEKDLIAGRMHDHVLLEEGAVSIMNIIFTLVMLGALIQGGVSVYRMRKVTGAPILLIPPAKVLFRAFLLGIALPMVIYFIYSRLPVIGGREFGLLAPMRWRFAIELSILIILVLTLPGVMLRRHIRRRCEDLEIETPSSRDERLAALIVRLVGGFGLAIIFAGLVLWNRDLGSDPMIGAIGLAVFASASFFTGRIRAKHKLYYGTLSRSMASVYAFAVIFISLTVQPFLMVKEAALLKQDKLVYGHIKSPSATGFTYWEEQVTARLKDRIREALD